MKRANAKRKGGNKVNPRSARTMLDTLKAYSGDFGAVKLTQGDLVIEVSFVGRTPPAPAPRKGRAKEDRKLSTIDSLSLPPRIWTPGEFGVQ